jgi:hypothetical protein
MSQLQGNDFYYLLNINMLLATALKTENIKTIYRITSATPGELMKQHEIKPFYFLVLEIWNMTFP